VQLPYKIEFPIGYLPVLDYQNKGLLIGSCFSENIGNKLGENLFDIDTNPFGVIYNPLSMAKALARIIDLKLFNQEDLFQSRGLYHSWEHHGSFSGQSVESTISKINERILGANAQLNSPNSFIILTFGSSNAFFKQGQIVANCHKTPNSEFSRELLPLSEMVEVWCSLLNRIKEINTDVKVLITVSPVRHLRDGLISNSRSKSRLFELSHSLCETFEFCNYFPSYEIAIDELRDYRFFEQDMTHPNSLAIDYIWQRLMESRMEPSTRDMIEQWTKLRKRLEHRSLHPKSKEDKKFKAKLQVDLERFEQKFNIQLSENKRNG